MALTLHGTVSDNTVALDRKTATPLIINGDMAIAQRGTSVTGTGSSQYLVGACGWVVGDLSVFNISWVVCKVQLTSVGICQHCDGWDLVCSSEVE